MADASLRIMVPVAEVAVEAYRAVFGRLGLWFDLAWLPLLMLLAAALLPGYLRLYLGWPGFARWAATVRIGRRGFDRGGRGTVGLNAFAVRWYQRLLFSGDRRIPDGIVPRRVGAVSAYTLLLYLGLGGTVHGPARRRRRGFTGLCRAARWRYRRVGLARHGALLAAVSGRRLRQADGDRRGVAGDARQFMAAPGLRHRGLRAGDPDRHPDPKRDFRRAASRRRRPSPLPLGFFLLRGVIGACANFVVVALGAAVLSGFYRRIMVRGLSAF